MIVTNLAPDAFDFQILTAAPRKIGLISDKGALEIMELFLTPDEKLYDKRIDEDAGLVTPFAERQRLVGKPQWDALEKRYS